MLNTLASDLSHFGHTLAQQQAAMKQAMQNQFGGNSVSFVKNQGGQDISTSLTSTTTIYEMQNGVLYFDEGDTGFINGMAIPNDSGGYDLTDSISSEPVN